MDKTPLVSIIIPVYNAEQYLPFCLDSVKNQSWSNLQIILIDDGSTDSSPQICDLYASTDNRIIVRHQENGGIAKAQNAGLDLAKGDYIAFIDNDDIMARDNIEILFHALVSNHADMSKARWQQFGISQIQEIKTKASNGTSLTGKTTSFSNPLQSYQTVFSKLFRVLGKMAGKNTEARYFNEANWCRLYARKVWDGVRFPEGIYAQDTAIAGELYLRSIMITSSQLRKTSFCVKRIMLYQREATTLLRVILKMRERLRRVLLKSNSLELTNCKFQI